MKSQISIGKWRSVPITSDIVEQHRQEVIATCGDDQDEWFRAWIQDIQALAINQRHLALSWFVIGFIAGALFV